MRPLVIGRHLLTAKAVLKNSFPGLGVIYKELCEKTAVDGRQLIEIYIPDGAEADAHKATVIRGLSFLGPKERTQDEALVIASGLSGHAWKKVGIETIEPDV